MSLLKSTYRNLAHAVNPGAKTRGEKAEADTKAKAEADAKAKADADALDAAAARETADKLEAAAARETADKLSKNKADGSIAMKLEAETGLSKIKENGYLEEAAMEEAKKLYYTEGVVGQDIPFKEHNCDEWFIIEKGSKTYTNQYDKNESVTVGPLFKLTSLGRPKYFWRTPKITQESFERNGMFSGNGKKNFEITFVQGGDNTEERKIFNENNVVNVFDRIIYFKKETIAGGTSRVKKRKSSSKKRKLSSKKRKSSKRY